ncbi:hypothetical protein PSEUBRA_003805 [Kalmanozyma brasiliensis GHG001]|uniref:uncharacterized protein n=1 Tax=Kalmanozyma brasiliensis (strain GHG001) TaxID=1365824 RepID=UPI001CEA73D3|nr:uncharacterized protein PSEUBRA_003805 [Kalmanozyma brasiliensis GHG001]KAF6767292.1 hypothetical protein PSEUBRA_003805 [Kalmanozyma brasiliensis GHG001]
MGHHTNCSKLAEACYKGYVATPPINTTYGLQVLFAGTIEDNQKLAECVETRLGNSISYENGFTSNLGCQLTLNRSTIGVDRSTNAAWPKHSTKNKVPTFFTYLAIFLSIISCFTMVTAAEPFKTHWPHRGRLQPGQLRKLGHGSWDNMTYHTNDDGQLQTMHHGSSGKTLRPIMNTQADMCPECDLLFWDGPHCTGNFYRLMSEAEPVDGKCDFPVGRFGCANLGLKPNAILWVSPGNRDSPSEAIVTIDQSCPPKPNGGTAIKPHGHCVPLGTVSGGEGLTCYFAGGSPMRKRRLSNGCDNFVTESHYESQSGIERVSPTIDCTSSTSDCTVQATQSKTHTIQSSWSLDNGGEFFSLSVHAIFGQEYSDEVTTGLSESFVIGSGYMGYIGAYTPVTVFVGTFTGCDDGIDKHGRAFAIKDEVHYRLVNTNW